MTGPELPASAAPAPERTGPARVLLLDLGPRRYALRAESVAGLAECGSLHPVPGAPAGVLGLSEWRGSVITVLDLQGALGEPAPGAPPCLVRLRPPLQQIALQVRAALSFRSFADARELAEEDDPTGCVERRFEHEGQQVLLLDPARWVRRLERDLRERR